MRLRELIRVLGWNALLILVVLLVAEAVFGGWLRGGGLGVLHVPRDIELRHDVSRVRPDGGIVLYRRDHWGLRGSHDDPSEIDILAVGGSTTNELYHDESECWTAVLQRRFADAGRRVTVANAGVDGHSTLGHLRSLEAWFPRVPGLKPKLIVFYVGINDVELGAQARYDAIVPQGAWDRVGRYISNNSAIANVWRMIQGVIRAQRARVVYRHDPPRLAPVAGVPAVNPAGRAAALAAYGRRIETLAKETRAMGARPVFVTQRRGDAFRADDGWLAAGPAAVTASEVQWLYNAAAMASCRAAGALCIDLAAQIDLRPEDFVDPIHTTTGGSRKVGDFLFARLKDAL